MIIRLATLVDKLYSYIPFIILLYVLLFHSIIFLSKQSIYNFDETIVTTISRQPLPSLLDTVKAEPHPPGFYLLLSLLPTNNISLTHLSVSIISVSLLLCALWFAHTSKTLFAYNLIPGLAIIFSSFGFLELSYSIKQEIITVPLLLVSFFITLRTLKSPLKEKHKYLIFLTALSLVIFFFGYVFYALSLLNILFVLQHSGSKNLVKRVLPMFSLHAIIVIGYMLAFGIPQFLNNLERFAWIHNNYNSLFRTLSTFLTAGIFYGVWSDLVVIAFFALLGILIYKFSRLPKNEKIRIGVLALITASLIGCYYAANLFVRIRYMFPIFFLLSILAGWGLRQLTYYKLATLGVVLVLLTFNSSIYYSSLTFTGTNDVMVKEIEARSILAQKKSGLLDEHPVFPFIFKINNPQFTELVPLNIFMPESQADYTTLSPEQILSEGKFYDLTVDEYAELLKQTGLTQFIYKMQIEDKPTYYDPQRKVFSTLVERCTLTDFIDVQYYHMLYIFTDCKF
ncbi:MAG: hypothetical protein QG639_96 [Patescibacteria group bacterium]|nr:hypothetical protein [Patescibacteria group bacterium]